MRHPLQATDTVVLGSGYHETRVATEALVANLERALAQLGHKMVRNVALSFAAQQVSSAKVADRCTISLAACGRTAFVWP